MKEYYYVKGMLSVYFYVPLVSALLITGGFQKLSNILSIYYLLLLIVVFIIVEFPCRFYMIRKIVMNERQVVFYTYLRQFRHSIDEISVDIKDTSGFGSNDSKMYIFKCFYKNRHRYFKAHYLRNRTANREYLQYITNVIKDGN